MDPLLGVQSSAALSDAPRRLFRELLGTIHTLDQVEEACEGAAASQTAVMVDKRTKDADDLVRRTPECG
jgi:hypothetical protein